MHECNDISSFSNHGTSGISFHLYHSRELPFKGECCYQGVPEVFKQTLVLLKLLNERRFNVLEILPGRQSLICSQYVSHKSSSAFNAFGYGKSSLKRSGNKLNFPFQLTFL